MDKDYSHSKSDYSYENNDDYNRRSEGEIYSDPDSSDEQRNRSWESDSRGRRRKEKKKSRDSSRSRSDKKDKRRKDKKRHRRRSSYSSRSRSRSRSRSHSRSRSRSRSRSHSWSRGRSDGKYSRRRRRSYDSHASNDSDCNGDRWAQDKFQDSYKYQEPNSTIMVRGLGSHLTELDIRQDILKCGIGIKDIRLIRHRETGASRGFAFVEFNTVQEASRWMDMKKGLLILEDQSQANLIYSVPKSAQGDKNIRNLSDWHCSNCQGHNFKRRDLCYKCHAPRPEEQDPELSDEVSSHPTSTIILSGLDALTTEEKVLQAFEANPNLASMPIRSVRIARESITNLSRGLCYVETNNVADAVRLYNALSRDSIEIDSRRASIAYCKPSTTGSSNKSVAATALAAAQWTNSGAATIASVSSDKDEIERLAQYSASVYAKTPEEHASYLEYYRDYYRNKTTEDSVVSSDSKKANESSSAATCDNFKTGSQASRAWADKASVTSSKDCPDTSRFQYDDSCGYYYDPVSELYYDPSTHYFYDSKKQQFLYWNADEQRYVPVKGKTTSSNASTVDVKDEKKKDNKRPEKQDKVKVAKKIAKEMEKWAKTLNQKKDYSKMPTTLDSNMASITNYYPQGTQKYETPDTSYSNSRNSPVSKLPTAVPESNSKIPLTPYDDDSDSDDDKTDKIINPVNPSSYNFTDYIKMACLLCKRQFPNKDVLDKHMKLSDLHKQNMDKFLKEVSISQSDGCSSSGFSTSYRDRAQERRLKFGSDQQEATNSLKDLYIKTRNDTKPVIYEEPSRDDNIGNRMLQKMGWQEGQGLGRVNQGRTDIISAERRAPNLGLGLRGPPLVDDEPDRYCRERKLTLARYQELDGM